MTQILSDFIRALRAQDVRISPAEAIEAGQALELLGYDNREILKQGLSNALAKSVDEKSAFDETFDKYFEFRSFSGKTPAGAQGEQQLQDDASPDSDGDSSGQQGQGGEGGSPTGGGTGQGQGQTSAPPDQSAAEAAEADLIDILERGDRA
ncbi:MAG: hypothetical protein KDJ44_04090, partial [Rhodoblastus sp.]|nr:hypothetical protein [Rhodoblastus sp.]